MDNFSTIYESDERIWERTDPNKGFVALDNAIYVGSRAVQKELFILNVDAEGAPKLVNGTEVFQQVLIDPDQTGLPSDMNYLIDGYKNAIEIAQILHKMTGNPVGIARCISSSFSSRLNARNALRRAQQREKPFHIHDQREEDEEMEQLKQRFKIN